MEYIKLPIDQVKLDINNPRIKKWLEIYGDEITGEAIALALSASSGNATASTYTALKESIKVNGGIINPIIVNKNEDGNYIVIEGNTRLQIYKDFLEADPEGPWKEIIAIVYNDLPDADIHAIRLQSHLVGPRDWDPFSKAKYLNQLSNIDKMPMSMIISFCGGKSGEIKKLIEAYVDMKKYYFPEVEKSGIDADPREFSKFSELQNTSVAQAIAIHKYNKSDFAKWVINGNIDTAQNVRKLPAILENKIAREEFLKTNISEAIKYLNASETGAKDLSKASMDELVVELINRCRNVEFKYIKSLKNDPRYEDKKLNIIEVIDELQEIMDAVEE